MKRIGNFLFELMSLNITLAGATRDERLGKISIVFLMLSVFLLIGTISADSLPIQQRINQKEAHKKTTVDVEIVVNQDKVFVGEGIPYKIRITHDPRTTEVKRVVPPDFCDVVSEDLKGPIKTHKKIDGVMCMEYNFFGKVYVKNTGPFSIPSVQVEYIERENRQRRSNFFSEIFSNFHQSQVYAVQAEGSIITVEQLPPYQGDPVQAVGLFTQAHIACDKVELKKGDAALVRYTVMGNGNCLLLEHPVLHLPDGLKGYNSEMRLVESGKVFEYVVQASETGSFQIPEQKFVYFDPQQRMYKELTTGSLGLHVDRALVTSAVEDDRVRELELLDTLLLDKEPEIETVIVPASIIRRIALPALVFWILLILLIAYPVAYASLPYLFAQKISFDLWLKKKKLLRKARAIIAQGKHKKDVVALYEVFKKLQCEVNWDPDSQVYHSWNIFWALLVNARFGQEVISSSHDFVQEVEQWIIFFEKKVV